MKQGAIMTLPSGEQIQIFPSDNPWNQYISKLAVHERNDDYIATIGPDVDVYMDLSIPYCIVSKDQAKVPLDLRYTGESDPGPYPVPDDAPVEGGPRNGQALIVIKGPRSLQIQRCANRAFFNRCRSRFANRNRGEQLRRKRIEVERAPTIRTTT